MKTIPSASKGEYAVSGDEPASLARLLDARTPVTQRLSSILVPVELTRVGDGLVRDAAIVANLFGARLIGVRSSPALSSTPGDVELEAAQALARAAAARFAALSRPVNAPCQWVEGTGSLPAALEDWAWSADLVMLAGKRSESRRAWEIQLRKVLHRARRPILVRSAGEGCSVLDHVVVVWSETAASSEATRAALPFLGRANTVTLVAPPWRRWLGAREAALDAVRRGLLSRNIQPAVVRLDHRLSASRLADQVTDLAPDLVVAAMPKPWPFHGPRLGARDLDRLRTNLLIVG